MTERYIDANDLQARLERKKAGIANQRYTEGWNDCMMRVKSMVSTAPAVDVALVVHGRWDVNVGMNFYRERNCPVCKKRIKSNFWNYCPNCGTKMDGGIDDDN